MDLLLSACYYREVTIPQHSRSVRVTHWLTTLCILALFVSGIELIISHPRFYWGEDGNALSPSLFDIPIPASRPYVKTGYNFVLPDQNGWSRSLHFQSAWIIIFTGIFYVASGIRSGHFRRNLLGPGSYNPKQRLVYLAVIFGLLPLMIWTGLAMSPSIAAAFPWIVELAGGHQSARTIHFFATLSVIAFVCVHLLMIIRAGFKNHVQAMISGQEQP